MTSFIDFFWSQVDVLGPDECWLWKMSCQHSGYGQTYFEKKVVTSHRLAFFLTNGYWPKICRHTCDNRPCCNPNHLVDGTHNDNVSDMWKHGNRGNAKLTPLEVIAVRNAFGNQAEIGSRFGITQSAVSLIKLGKVWVSEKTKVG